MQDTRHRILRPLVLGVAVAAVVAAALVLIVREGDIRAAGQLAVMILGRGATAILHCGTTKLAGHLHFMTRRPLQQLPFLRRVPRECSPVGQCISIGPSERRDNYYACGHAMRVRTRAREARCSRSRDPLFRKSGAEIGAHGWIVSSLCRVAPRTSTTGQRVKVITRHVSYIPLRVPVRTSAIGSRASSSRNLYPLSAIHRRHSLPLSQAILFAERIARLFF